MDAAIASLFPLASFISIPSSPPHGRYLDYLISIIRVYSNFSSPDAMGDTRNIYFFSASGVGSFPGEVRVFAEVGSGFFVLAL